MEIACLKINEPHNFTSSIQLSNDDKLDIL